MYNLMTLEEISRKLQDRTLTKVKKSTGISMPTLMRLRDCENENYTLRTIRRISGYLKEMEG